MRFLVLISFVLIVYSSHGQEIRKLRATDFMIKRGDGPWSELEKSNLLIVMGDRRITIYSKEQQEFDTYSYGQELESPDDPNDLCRELKCIDQHGLKCTIFIFRKEGIYLISVKYNDLWYTYGVKEI